MFLGWKYKKYKYIYIYIYFEKGDVNQLNDKTLRFRNNFSK